MLSNKIVLLLTLTFALAACGGGGDGDGSSSNDDTASVPSVDITPSDPFTIPSSATTVTISGTAMFERPSFSSTILDGLDFNTTAPQPIRGATIELLDDNSNVIASSVTSPTGEYSFTANPNQDVQVRILSVTQSTGTASWDFEVRDNTNNDAIYALTGSIANSGSSDSIRDLTAETGFDTSSNTYTDTRAAGPFAILDTVTDSINLVLGVDASVSMPATDIFWSVQNVPVSGDTDIGEISTSFYSAQQIFILGAADVDTDEFDAHVVAHEWGHYFEDNLARSDSIGGPHNSFDILDPRIAFSEGFSNALSGITLGDPLYRDSGGVSQGSDVVLFSVEFNVFDGSTPDGWFNEGSVDRIVYDIFDSVDEPNDTVTLGFDSIYNAMTSPAFINQSSFATIFSLINIIQTQNPNLSSEINTIIAAENISTITDNFGSTEANSGGNPDNLPPYKLISDDGNPVMVCSTDDNGEFNNLGNRQLLLLDNTSAGPTVITANRVSGLNPSDPDIGLHLNGTLIGAAQTGNVNIDALTINLAVDEYVIEVFEFLNVAGSDFGDTGDVCFNVTVN